MSQTTCEEEWRHEESDTYICDTYQSVTLIVIQLDYVLLIESIQLVE